MSHPKTPEDWIKTYRRAAGQRLATAQLLHKHECYVDQFYLTGYVCECTLKALILHETSVGERRRKLLADIRRGASSHNYVFLKSKYPGSFPIDGLKILRRIEEYQWTTDRRYDVSKGDSATAKRFLIDAQELLEWVERRLK